MVRDFFSTSDGVRWTPKEVSFMFPDINERAIRAAMRRLRDINYLTREDKAAVVGGSMRYWLTRKDKTTGFFLMKPTETKQYRHR